MITETTPRHIEVIMTESYVTEPLSNGTPEKTHCISIDAERMKELRSLSLTKNLADFRWPKTLLSRTVYLIKTGFMFFYYQLFNSLTVLAKNSSEHHHFTLQLSGIGQPLRPP
jgi:hypothetical protein